LPTKLSVHYLGLADYGEVWHNMQRYTAQRDEHSEDQIWFVQHPPVYTLGLNKKGVRMPTRDDIPVIAIDRGGKITYHGPGQLVMYVLIDLKRLGCNVRQLVSALENSVIHLLDTHGIQAQARTDAPGVYVEGKKIASVGLRLKHERCYHGLSLNVDMDLAPFSAIDPCGYQGLQVTQMKDLGLSLSEQDIAAKLLEIFKQQLGYQ
jgi:lipoyl(octanoyl) transferase